MITRMCMLCSWYREKNDFCAVHKRDVSPNYSCDFFHSVSEEFLMDSPDSQESPATYTNQYNKLKHPNHLQLSPPSFIYPFSLMVLSETNSDIKGETKWLGDTVQTARSLKQP